MQPKGTARIKYVSNLKFRFKTIKSKQIQTVISHTYLHPNTIYGQNSRITAKTLFTWDRVINDGYVGSLMFLVTYFWTEILFYLRFVTMIDRSIMFTFHKKFMNDLKKLHCFHNSWTNLFLVFNNNPRTRPF